jgi:hypothetical protein
MIRKFADGLISSAIVVGVASTGNGAGIPPATVVKNPPAVPFNAPEGALPGPSVSDQIGPLTTVGELIGADDVTINGNVLHKRWSDENFEGFTSSTPKGAALDGGGDSHLTDPAGSPFGAGPSEANTKIGSPLASTPDDTEYGFGNLSGARDIQNSAQTANVAYLVMLMITIVAYMFMLLHFFARRRSPRKPLIRVSHYSRKVPKWGFRRSTPRCISELGLSMPCTEDDVMTAYRQKAKTLHPDRGGSSREFSKLQQHFEQARALVSGSRVSQN